MILITTDTARKWTHNCIQFGALVLDTEFCPHCGASKLNEPSEGAIHDYMELNYDN